MSLARNLLEAEVAKSDTLVIHLDDRSTDFLKPIYEGNGYPVISGRITPEEMMAQIKAHQRVYGLGHGSPSGLFARGFMLDDQFGPALAEKPDGLYIWCNADAYAKRNRLSGLVSGMFISEVMEARMFGIEATQAQVDASNNMFSKLVRELIDTGQPLSGIRQCYASSNPACKISQFNAERLYIFEKGVPTPALHQSSLGNDPYHSEPRKPRQYGDPNASIHYRDEEPEETPEEAFRAWGRELYKQATEAGYPLHNLSHNDQLMLGDLFMQGASPEDALDMLMFGGTSTEFQRGGNPF